MRSTFLEGIVAVPDPCSLVLVGISIAAVVLSRHRVGALEAVMVAAIVGVWNLAAGWFILEPSLNWVAYGVAACGLALVVFARRFRWASAVGSGVAVFAATLWWVPCVGPRFGALLSDTIRDGIVPVLVPLGVYVSGLMVPAMIATVMAQLISSVYAGRVGQSGTDSDPTDTASSREAGENARPAAAQ